MEDEKMRSENLSFKWEEGENVSEEVLRWKLERRNLKVKMRMKKVIYSVWEVVKRYDEWLKFEFKMELVECNDMIPNVLLRNSKRASYDSKLLTYDSKQCCSK